MTITLLLISHSYTTPPDPFKLVQSCSNVASVEAMMIMDISPVSVIMEFIPILVQTAIGATTAGVGIVVVFAVRYFSLAQRRLTFKKTGESDDDQNVEDFITTYGFLAPKMYNYSEVKKITNSFCDQLGKGGYGVVYKRKLSDGCLVAVKVINESKGSGEEFINEVSSISRRSHVNIVSFLGFCNERNKRALIYEFVFNSSLDKFFYDSGSSTLTCNLD
ncbi:hypothetical protein PIB30_005614 [Stylosanthes scabra]|uniref:Protein kinase domain-containing protein n=1 Tax=Stylosanthes scabra TaxID=79078 RepID=A0ABU6S3I1_9FABA|nr:hypothetical protein [Stylosanthes scabra]